MPTGGVSAWRRVRVRRVQTTSRSPPDRPSRQGEQLSAPPANGTVQRPCGVRSGVSATSSPDSRSVTAPAYAASRLSAVWRPPSRSKVTKSRGPRSSYAAQWCAPNPTGRGSTPRTSGSQARRTSARTAASTTSAGRSRIASALAEPVEGPAARRLADQLEQRGGRLVGTVRRVDLEVAVAVLEDLSLLEDRGPGVAVAAGLLASPDLGRGAGDVHEQDVETGGEPEQVVEAPGLAEDVVADHVAARGDRAGERTVVRRPGAAEDVVPLARRQVRGVRPGADLVEQVDGEDQPRRRQSIGDGVGERRLARTRRPVEKDESTLGRHGPTLPTPGPPAPEVAATADLHALVRAGVSAGRGGRSAPVTRPRVRVLLSV